MRGSYKLPGRHENTYRKGGGKEKDRQHISINAIAQRRDKTKKEGEKIKFWNETYSLAGARSSSGVIVKVKPAKGTEPFSSFFFFLLYAFWIL